MAGIPGDSDTDMYRPSTVCQSFTTATDEKVDELIRLHALEPDSKACSTHRNHLQLEWDRGSSPSETGKDWTQSRYQCNGNAFVKRDGDRDPLRALHGTPTYIDTPSVIERYSTIFSGSMPAVKGCLMAASDVVL